MRTTKAWRMIRVVPTARTSFHLDAPPELVFDFIADARNELGSQVTMDVDMRPRGAFRLLTPVLKLGLPREMAKRPDQLGGVLEA